ncbi:hypothetical protein BGZ65_006687 [Modicella reniformis]|uniref:ACB domain-containing protein n=1 Tax=Modicella reniformis TaxID=1440133 RepID=A0A9P6IVY0_9FUNG|nr:hypothetical protein BGZ65_006687 [Modicella reniformis]
MQLYGAYKQATMGDIKTLKPSFYEFAARSKWQAWANMQGTIQQDAQETYVQLVVKSMTKPGSHPDHHLLADEILQRPPTPSSPIVLSRTNSPPPYDSLHLDKDLPPTTSFTTIVKGGKTTDSGFYEARVPMVENVYLSSDKHTTGEDQPVLEYVEESDDDDGDGDEEDDGEVYQSSVEYDEDDNEHSSSNSRDPVNPLNEDKFEKSSIQSLVLKVPHDSAQESRRNKSDDFVDEGVFDEEEKDEQEVEVQGLLEALKPVTDIVVQDQKDGKLDVPVFKPRISGDGSVASGHGGSAQSGKETEPANTLNMLIPGEDRGRDIDTKHSDLISPPPPATSYQVNALYGTTISPLSAEQQTDQQSAATSVSSTPSLSLAPLSVPPTSETSPPPASPSPSPSPERSGPTEELVCPVSKLTASSGEVCPAAMFAQARVNANANANTDPISARAAPPIIETHRSALSNPATPFEAPSNPATPSEAQPAPSSSSSSSTSSAVTAATNQGKRIGQGIVNRFTALKSSLAAASARATSLALPGSSNSIKNAKDPNAMVVRDPVTNQSVTVICPHTTSMQVIETEIVRLQTDISVLHERLDLLQESLKIKSQTRELERRSPRGIITLVLRQGLINAILLLIVFAILYKRRSPIAFAIVAYIGQGRKEGEAGWHAFVKRCTDLIKIGRTNGYW